jgi:hypothetical protein
MAAWFHWIETMRNCAPPRRSALPFDGSQVRDHHEWVPRATELPGERRLDPAARSSSTDVENSSPRPPAVRTLPFGRGDPTLLSVCQGATRLQVIRSGRHGQPASRPSVGARLNTWGHVIDRPGAAGVTLIRVSPHRAARALFGSIGRPGCIGRSTPVTANDDDDGGSFVPAGSRSQRCGWNRRQQSPVRARYSNRTSPLTMNCDGGLSEDRSF